ncbi:uncharacterized protein TRIVIDRAFT_152771 [Trichoderma virens Gv29-8]|uniref:Uncharacterized protein n=1 Tax=Hypocrea virens (strain Gv29-8 / FGSC 10586) TaxID=413071 RepID=G9MW58_HYPVG|nr:uncharacterized protein TRIVIDRAFT_152771 [Trichoderma virens Gv29-8]EHK21354.1 hypothetical protein TRIVIDRAFT_152771 [Trichoderma virens Gv29-8]
MDKRIFRHEKYLKSVTFPDLSGQAPFMSNEDLKQDHREVNDVLQWLSDQNVQGIMGLFVEDRLQCPHNDEDVTKCVNEFNVRVLNWRKLDIYLKDFDKELVEELHLYSSGNRSVHDQWLDQIPRFKRVSCQTLPRHRERAYAYYTS